MGWRLLFVHYTVLVYIKSIKILRKLMADIYTDEDKDLFCAWFCAWSNHAINYTLSFWLGVFSYRQKVDHAVTFCKLPKPKCVRSKRWSVYWCFSSICRGLFTRWSGPISVQESHASRQSRGCPEINAIACLWGLWDYTANYLWASNFDLKIKLV
jgi:hypothetical protein